ncbi:hypothetical protein [Candidatus Lariskella endosymbiont of Hedychridium roseum]|uniref:hypothetical protein n=1 Tax=Candidatus Lariskella endosymbiont of Hedychridium roseum TaxID=3077949 RepID=UPI0030CCB953
MYIMLDAALYKGMSIGLKQGIAEGKIEGKREGQLEEKMKIATNLLLQGFDVNVIERVTELSRYIRPLA